LIGDTVRFLLVDVSGRVHHQLRLYACVRVCRYPAEIVRKARWRRSGRSSFGFFNMSLQHPLQRLIPDRAL
jgi:hypothetical protein